MSLKLPVLQEHVCAATVSLASSITVAKGIQKQYSEVRYAMQVDGVAEVHDLHVWGIKPGMPILAAHVTTQSGKDGNAVLGRVTEYCRSVGIDHSTIQISDQDAACPCSTYPDGINGTTSQSAAGHRHENNHNGHSRDHEHSHEREHDHAHSHQHSEDAHAPAKPTASGSHSHAHQLSKRDHQHSPTGSDNV